MQQKFMTKVSFLLLTTVLVIESTTIPGTRLFTEDIYTMGVGPPSRRHSVIHQQNILHQIGAMFALGGGKVSDTFCIFFFSKAQYESRSLLMRIKVYEVTLRFYYKHLRVYILSQGLITCSVYVNYIEIEQSYLLVEETVAICDVLAVPK